MSDEWERENLKAAFQFGDRALQSALIVNGGAAVALLTFLGHYTVSAPTLRVCLWGLKAALITFCVGVASVLVAAAFGWIAQLQTIDSGNGKDRGIPARWVAGSFGLFSIVTFLSGAVTAALSVG